MFGLEISLEAEQKTVLGSSRAARARRAIPKSSTLPRPARTPTNMQSSLYLYLYCQLRSDNPVDLLENASLSLVFTVNGTCV